MATRWYRSPELLLMSDTMQYGKEVDIWAVGCIMGEITDGQPLFPGESEIDQLFVIQKVLGPLPKYLHEEFLKNPRFIGLKFPDVTKPETLEKRYLNKMNKVELSFMCGLLDMNHHSRLTASEALMHAYFDDIREPHITEMLGGRAISPESIKRPPPQPSAFSKKSTQSIMSNQSTTTTRKSKDNVKMGTHRNSNTGTS